MTADAFESVAANGGEAVTQEQSDRDPSPTTTSSHDPANAKDEFDGSYVFVSGTDDRDKDLVDSDLNSGETIHLPAENNDSVQLEEGESLVVVEKPDHNGVNDDKVEGGGEETHGSNGDCQTEKETIAVDQSEPPSHNGGVEAVEFSYDLSTADNKAEDETISVDQSEQLALNGEVEATTDHKTENETITIDQSEQPAHSGDVEAVEISCDLSTPDHKIESETISIDQSEQPALSGDVEVVEISRDLSTPDHKIENEMIVIDQSEQSAHNGDVEAVEIIGHLSTADHKIENDAIVIDHSEQPAHNGDVEAVEISSHLSTSDHKIEKETVVIDQPEQPAHNGDVEAVEISCDLPTADHKTENDTVVIDQSELPAHDAEVEVVEISNDLSTADHKTDNETEVIVQSEPPAHNVEVEAEESNDDPRGEDVHGSMTTDHKTESEMVAVDIPEQSTYNGDVEAANDDKAEDKPDLAADKKEHLESDIGVTDVQSSTHQEKEQAEPFNEIPSGDSSGSPINDLEQVQQDPTIAPCAEAVIKDLPVSNESCDVVPAAVYEQDGISEGVVHENPAEENGPSALDDEKPLSLSEEVPVEGSLGDNGVDLERSLETPSCSEVDQTTEVELNEGPLSENNGEDLAAGLEQESISETVIITDSVDASQNTPEQTESVENAESLTSSYDGSNALVSGENVPDASVNKITENSDVENEASLPAGDLSSCDVEEVRSEADNGKSNQESIEIIPNSLDNDVSFQPEIVSTSNVEEKVSTTDAIVVESENSDRTPECAGSQSISWAESVDHDSSLPVLVAADVKPEYEAENASAISERDMPGDDVTASEGKDTESGVDSNHILENVDNDVNSTCQEVASIDRNQKDEASTSLPEDSSEGQNVEVEVVKRPFYFLIRIPRFDDGDLREQIKDAQSQVEERTKSRDAFRAHIQTKRAALKDYSDKVQALLTEERAARDLFKSKRQEMDSALSEINKVKNALSVGDIDGRIRSMEHMIEHETLPLKEEKQYIREIKQLKQHREQLSSSMGTKDEIQQTLDQKDKIEDRLKVLRKELDQLRDKLNKAEEATQTAKKSFKDENEKLNSILSQYRAADDVRQDAYAHLQSLRKQQYEKNKNFWRYKDDAKAAQNLSLNGDKEQLQCLCLDQVERTMELWNNNDAFRREYIKWNTRSTLRRLRTSDGRALGPDEEPPVIPDIVNNRVYKDNYVKVASIPQEVKQESLVKVEKPDHKSVAKVVEREDRTAKTKAAKSTISPAIISREDETKEKEKEKEKVEEPRRTKEEEELARKEEELARKAEELRKEEAAAKLKQLRKLEEKAKAKEAMDRKKKMAEKARIRAEIRAQKEAEEKEKERERRAKKKERKKANETDVTNEDEVDSAPTSSSEVAAASTIESETKERSTTAAVKRPQKGSQFLKPSRAKSMPLPLRNRGRRRMQPWMWGALALVVVVLALFLAGIGGFSYKSCLRWFGL
ncbi:uncharacterized protein LOC133816979 [Humulus lupulus]|uniref:uncharacterized protein LOC133816979 n=1 Tax=Humulus lupulus TaxID=3486 RepID=UPI002B403CA9|nr:uncharacterized protein LOC133816979 [Humulus lupulus]